MASGAPVTVVVASRDRRRLLLRTLPRHLALPERPAVVLVDNGSGDGTPAAVRAALPAVEVVELGRNAGAAARNAGLERARTPYVAFCDDDSWFAPGSLARAVAVLDGAPRLAVLNAHILVGPEERADPVCAEMAASPLPRAPGQPGRALLSFIACAVVVRRDALLAAGGFEERLGVGGEEGLLSWDLLASGWQLSYVPEVVAHHHPPPSGGRPERAMRDVRNALWTAWLRRPALAAARSTVRELRRSPARPATARGVAGAVAGLPWVLRERRVAPAHVERMCRLLEEEDVPRARSGRGGA